MASINFPLLNPHNDLIYLGSFALTGTDEKAHLFIKNQTKLKGWIQTKEGQYEKIKVTGGFQGELSHAQTIDLIQKQSMQALYSPSTPKKLFIVPLTFGRLHHADLPPAASHLVERKNHKGQIYSAFQNAHKHLVILNNEEGVPCKTGKTEIAKDYALTYGNLYKKVLRLSLDHPIDPQMLLWLSENENWLLVLDNVDHKKKLNGIDLAQLQTKGHILLTTRERNWKEYPEAQVISIGVFSPEEAELYLSQQLKNASPQVLHKIAVALDYAPTALQKAAQEIQEAMVPVEFYLSRRSDTFKNNERVLKEKSNLPPQNSKFVGREPHLLALEETLAQGTPLVLAAEVGLGGIGKTQIAFRLACRLAHHYPFIWLINCENETSFVDSYRSLANRLGISLSEQEKSIPNALFKKVNHHLQKNPGWLLIFDDANDASIATYFPKSGGHVLITSRSTKWENVAQICKIGVFKTQESVDLLLKITGFSGQEKEAADLGNLLENLPLAVAQAAYYIKEINESRKMSIAEYIERFKQERKELWRTENPPEDLYQFTVSVTWKISLDRIAQEEKLQYDAEVAIPLLRVCSLLGTREIPRQLVFENWIQATFGNTVSSRELNVAFSLLGRYSIIELTEQRIHIHSLVQLVVQDSLSPEALRNAVKEVYKVFIQHPPGKGKAPIFCYWDSTPATVNQLYWLQAHGLSLATHAEAMGLKDEAVELLTTIGCFSYHQGHLHLAEQLLRKSLDVKVTAGAQKNLGNVCVNLGKLEEAKSWYEKCQDRDGFIQILIRQGKWNEAEKMLHEEVARLADKIDPIGTTNIKYYRGFVLKHLGYVLLKKGQPDQAVPHLLSARTCFEEIYKSENTFTAETDYFLAQAYEQLHDTVNQEKHLRHVVRLYESIIQSDKPDTIHDRLISCLKTLGTIALRNQNPLEAEKSFQKSIDYSKRKFGIQDTTLLVQLADIYYSSGKLDLAIATYEAIVKEKDDQNSFHNIGCLYQLKGNAVAAETHFKRALSMQPHSGTWTEYANFLCLHQRQAEAEKILLQVINRPDDQHRLMYGMIELASLPLLLQKEVHQRGSLQISARHFAFFLLIQIYGKQAKGQELYTQFEKELSNTGSSFDHQLLKYCHEAVTQE